MVTRTAHAVSAPEPSTDNEARSERERERGGERRRESERNGRRWGNVGQDRIDTMRKKLRWHIERETIVGEAGMEKKMLQKR